MASFICLIWKLDTCCYFCERCFSRVIFKRRYGRCITKRGHCPTANSTSNFDVIDNGKQIIDFEENVLNNQYTDSSKRQINRQNSDERTISSRDPSWTTVIVTKLK